MSKDIIIKLNARDRGSNVIRVIASEELRYYSQTGPWAAMLKDTAFKCNPRMPALCAGIARAFKQLKRFEDAAAGLHLAVSRATLAFMTEQSRISKFNRGVPYGQ